MTLCPLNPSSSNPDMTICNGLKVMLSPGHLLTQYGNELSWFGLSKNPDRSHVQVHVIELHFLCCYVNIENRIKNLGCTRK